MERAKERRREQVQMSLMLKCLKAKTMLQLAEVQIQVFNKKLQLSQETFINHSVLVMLGKLNQPLTTW
jgi:hypothetical protein